VCLGRDYATTGAAAVSARARLERSRLGELVEGRLRAGKADRVARERGELGDQAQIIDADDLLDLSMGPKRSFVIDPPSVAIAGIQSSGLTRSGRALP
jgi:hypothetical protein